jgi:hypothetical protein
MQPRAGEAEDPISGELGAVWLSNVVCNSGRALGNAVTFHLVATMKRISVIFGTRPEAIKLCPLVLELRKHPEFQTGVCVTGQHREMLDQVLDVFGVAPDMDLDLMQPGQTLVGLTRGQFWRWTRGW